jgi:hypothetical protein
METVIERVRQNRTESYVHTQTPTTSERKSLSILQRYDAFIKRLEFSHYGIMTMAILIGSCLGSISAMFVFYNGAPIWVFAIGLFATLANLVASISQAPTKWMVSVFLLSVVVNVTLVALFPML